MATSASSSSSLLALLVFLLTFQLFLCVKSDQALITHLCKKTAEPEICSHCLNSDASSKTADSKGLALTAAKCWINDAATMFESISLLSQKTPMNSPLKTILLDCAFNTSLALELYDPVSSFINQQKYATAKVIISELIMPYSNSCFNEFHGQPKVIVPSEVLSTTREVTKGLNVVLGILNNL